MGERGQILIKDTGVYLYTHWTGYRLKNILQESLSKKWRWNDEDYLTRIIFDVMTKEEHGTDTGYGIGSTQKSDLNYPLLIVDVKNQMVFEELKLWSFENFLKEKFEEE